MSSTLAQLIFLIVALFAMMNQIEASPQPKANIFDNLEDLANSIIGDGHHH